VHLRNRPAAATSALVKRTSARADLSPDTVNAFSAHGLVVGQGKFALVSNLKSINRLQPILDF